MVKDNMNENSVSRVFERIKRADLRVQELDPAIHFYSDVAGLEVLNRSNGTADLGPRGESAIISLDSTGVTKPADPNAAGLFHTAIRFPTKPALGRALSRVAEAGLELGSSDHGVSEALYLTDPSGNGVELYYDRDRDLWPKPGPGERVGMFSRPLDLRALLEAGSDFDESSGPAPPGTDVGHVHLGASDLDATTTFFERLLGMDLVTQIEAQASFLSAQGYHHHIGANIWRSRGRPAATPEQAGLTRIVFARGDDAELDALKKRLDDAGRSYSADGGRLSVVDPNGIELVLE